MSILNALSKALSTALISKLSPLLVEKFDLDSSDVDEVLYTFISENLGSTKKTKVKRGPTGYTLYCSEHRKKVTNTIKAKKENEGLSHKELFPKFTKALAAMWNKLSEDKQAEWVEKAKASSEAGSEVSTEEETEKPVKKTAKSSKATKKSSKPKPVEMKVYKDKEFNVWRATDTDYVVQSNKKKIVTSKLVDGEVTPLTEEDVDDLTTLGWDFQPLEPVTAADEEDAEVDGEDENAEAEDD